MGYTTTFIGGFSLGHLTPIMANAINMTILSWEHDDGKYCPWRIEQDIDGKYLLMCETGKSQNYSFWIMKLLNKFKNKYSLNGVVHWRGEDFTDSGKIVIRSNAITFYKSKYVTCEP